MGTYKKIKTNISETILSFREIILGLYAIIFAITSVYFINENDKLLKQVDEIDGKYNEVSYQADLINNAYEDLRKEYERLVDYIRTSDKYEMPEGMEE